METSGRSVRKVTLEDRIRDINQRLAREFNGYFSAEQIARVSSESLGPFRNATVKDFVPLFVTRATRERLLETIAAGSSLDKSPAV